MREAQGGVFFDSAVAVRGPDDLRGGVRGPGDFGCAVGVDDEDGEQEGVAGFGAVEAAGEGRAQSASEEEDADRCAVGVRDIVIERIEREVVGPCSGETCSREVVKPSGDRVEKERSAASEEDGEEKMQWPHLSKLEMMELELGGDFCYRLSCCGWQRVEKDD